MRQFVSSKICLNCRGCCRFSQSDSPWAPSILGKEIKKVFRKKSLAGYLSEKKSIRLKSYPSGDCYVCPFLDLGGNRCSIYKERPFECRLYPFLLQKKESGLFLALDLNCPIASAEKDYPGFKKYRDYLIRHLKRTAQKKILKNNLHLFKDYPGTEEIARIIL